jgi:hypothetical protein
MGGMPYGMSGGMPWFVLVAGINGADTTHNSHSFGRERMDEMRA